jgi:hypothetical protein
MGDTAQQALALVYEPKNVDKINGKGERASLFSMLLMAVLFVYAAPVLAARYQKNLHHTASTM